MLTALSNRFDAVERLREDAGLLVARARHRGQPVLLYHRGGLPGTTDEADHAVVQRLKALGGFGAPIAWHYGPAGVTWVADADDGVFLDDWLARRRAVPLSQALQLLLHLAQALDTLHRHGILHLRLRPACVRVVGDEEPAARLIAVEALLADEAVQAATRDIHDVRYSAPELGGRTAGQPDARTDLYLLGLLAWRLLADRLPFEAADALGWLHAHLAVQPPPLRAFRPDAPAAVAELVHSLLAKSPAARPPSARAVAQDLRRCLEALHRPSPGAAITLRAPHARFQLPRTLVGRAGERRALREALARVGQGAVEAITIRGPSGIGKTALAADLEGDVLAAGGVFAAAKSDQLGSTRPFAAMSDLLDALGRQLLRGPHGIAAIGPDADALAGLSPHLDRALGLRATDSEVPSAQARQRLLAALVHLLAALGRDRPVVLMLDDVQWSDADSLALVAGALSDRAVQRVLLLMAERTDTGSTHRSAEALDLPGPTTIVLRPLDEGEMRSWMALALPGGLQQPSATLARLATRSAGNPLFLGQLVKAMVLQGQLVPDTEGRWHLDERPAAWDALPDSVLDAARRRLQTLGKAEALLLAHAARLGAQFDPGLLARVVGLPADGVGMQLRSAEAEGLLEPAGEDGAWRFVHDGLQQAAYELVPAEQGLRMHLQIGRLLRDVPEAQQLFEACRHLNLATQLLSPEELPGLLRLNHEAGRQARMRAGFAEYATLMRAAVALLPHCELPNAQHRALLHDAAEALLMERDFDASRACLDQADALSGDPLESARCAELRIQWLIAQERAQEALQLGLEALSRVGLNVRPERATVETVWELLRLKLLLRGRSPASWLAAPESHDPRHDRILRLIFATVSVAHTLASPVYAVLGLAGTRMSLQQGWTPWSAQPVAVAAHVLAGVFGDIDTGHALGELSLRLGERFGTHGLSFNHLFYVMHWKAPVSETLPLLRQCFEQAERAGNFEIAGYAAGMYLGITWNAMHSLRALEVALHDVRAFSRRRAHDLTNDCCDTFEWLLAQLRGPQLRGPLPARRHRRADGRSLAHDPLFDLVHDQLAVMLNVMVGHHGDDVVACGERVRRNLHRMAGNFSTPLHHWFEGLLHAGRLRERPASGSLRLVRRHLQKLRTWSAHCPANHAHRVISLEAELAALARTGDVERLYGDAVELAVRNGFVGDAAIIAHLWARHCGRSGDPDRFARAMDRAHALYAQWGATGMLRHLEENLPAFARAAQPAQVLPLDTGTLVKASQAISAELEMGAVARRLLQQAMENAGARYGALLVEERGHLRLAAEASEAGARVEGRTGQPVEQTALPTELLRGVRQTGQSVLLADAAGSHAYGSCARWQGVLHVSVLCVPVLAASNTVGVLYLENELIAGCFTPERAMLAHLLASQAAIAMANARLFQELAAAHDDLRQANSRLEERVAERTRALEENHARLRQLERQHAADEERQRIMADLHDGLGSQLFVTLSRVDRNELDARQVRDALRACIADMRLVLEAMSPDGADFLAAWGSFRFRWEGQLQDAGVASRWEVTAANESVPLAATTGLQVLRVAQEGLTNVLKHARAQGVRVRLAATGRNLQLEIADDGIGLPRDAAKAGRGLGNMHARAARMRGTLSLAPGNPGTLLRLEVPLR